MKTKYYFVLPLLALGGCGDSTPMNTDMAMGGGKDMSMNAMPDMTMTGMPDMAMIPPVPMLGKQLDRMGRPAVNTALTDPFGLCMKDPLTECAGFKGMTTDQIKDAYNAEGDPTKWANFLPLIAMNIAIFDGADTTCGNQAGYNAGGNGNTGKYGLLAGALADDELYINSKNSTCSQYLGVEFAALGIANTDCGGRTPTENTIDVTYNVLVGTPPGTVTNGIMKDADNPPDPTTFPFLGMSN